MLDGGGAGWGVFEKWCVKVASDAGGNGTAGLDITMGHGEGRDQAWLVYGSVWGELEWRGRQLLPDEGRPELGRRHVLALLVRVHVGGLALEGCVWA